MCREAPLYLLYLLDTNIVVHYVRDDRLADWIHNHYSFADRSVRRTISVVTEGEIRSLALQFGWGRARLRKMEELLGRAIIVPLDYQGVVEAYAEIDAHCRRVGKPVGENDTWIAATAKATGARLLTTNRDFQHLDPQFIDPALHR